MSKISGKIITMFDGLGINPQNLVELNEAEVSQKYKHIVGSPLPVTGRYQKYIAFMGDLTSLEAWYRYRITVIVEYFIVLAETMAGYDGKFRDKKIIPYSLTEPMKEALRSLAPNLTFQQMLQIEMIETKSDHDVAAITDWLKFIVDQQDILGFVKANEETRLELKIPLTGSILAGRQKMSIRRHSP